MSKAISLNTERLVLRPWKPNDPGAFRPPEW